MIFWKARKIHINIHVQTTNTQIVCRICVCFTYAAECFSTAILEYCGITYVTITKLAVTKLLQNIRFFCDAIQSVRLHNFVNEYVCVCIYLCYLKDINGKVKGKWEKRSTIVLYCDLEGKVRGGLQKIIYNFFWIWDSRYYFWL